MSDKEIEVLIGGYLTPQPATADYEDLLKSGATINGAVCITRDLEGKMSIVETDHMKAKGAKVLGGVGFVVGLFAPPLLLSTVLGAAVGAAFGHLASKKLETKIEKQAEETIPWGGAGLIVAYPTESADAVDKAVSRALKKVTGKAEGSGTKALKEALADAQKNANG
ncbi:MAG: DUF1269 domain-containing protein [Anaerolineae bacterium]